MYGITHFLQKEIRRILFPLDVLKKKKNIELNAELINPEERV